MTLKNTFVLVRYLFLFLIGLSNLYVLYLIFTPLTIWMSFHLLSLFYNVTFLSSSVFAVNDVAIEIAPACVAGAAYYFLLILNLTTPMSPKRRFLSISFSLLSFLVLNVLRILGISFLLVKNSPFYASAHSITWHLGSTILLLIIWFSSVRIFRINSIPFLTDFRSIVGESGKRTISKKRRRHK